MNFINLNQSFIFFSLLHKHFFGSGTYSEDERRTAAAKPRQ
jgi:hypothetical protein